MIRIASVLPFTPPSPVREVKSHSFCQMNPQPHAVSVSAGLFKPRPGNPTCLRVLFGLRSVQHSVVGSNQGYEWNQGYVLCNGHGAVALTVYTNQSTQEKGMEVTASNLRDPRRGLNDSTGPRPWYLQDAAILRCGHLGTPPPAASTRAPMRLSRPYTQRDLSSLSLQAAPSAPAGDGSRPRYGARRTRSASGTTCTPTR